MLPCIIIKLESQEMTRKGRKLISSGMHQTIFTVNVESGLKALEFSYFVKLSERVDAAFHDDPVSC